VFKSMFTRIVCAVGFMMLGLIGVFADDVRLRFRDAHAAHSASALVTAQVVLVAGVVGIGVLLLVWIVIAPRHVMAQLRLLAATATDIADHRLPTVSRQLRYRTVHVEREIPAVSFAPDQFGTVGRAIIYLGRAAARGIIDAAEQRQIKHIVVRLARRSQGHTIQLLDALDALERRDLDPELLAALFDLDQRAVRLQRITDHALILAGEKPGRQWTRPQPMRDVIRAAGQEVEQPMAGFQRLDLSAAQAVPAGLHGHAVADVMHLVAALLDNALMYSPPHLPVTVTAEIVGTGCAITIEDRGLGMPVEKLAEYTEHLAHPPSDMLAVDLDHQGLFVVALLAQRHNIRVTLRSSPYGGVAAIVVIPMTLLDTAEEPTAIFATPAHALTAPPAGTPAGATADAVEAGPEPWGHPRWFSPNGTPNGQAPNGHGEAR
jgi:signal transduction histidine kinase